LSARASIHRPPDPGDPRSEPGHIVRFFDDDATLCEAVAEFLRPALLARGPALVVATAPHRLGIRGFLESKGVEVPPLVDSGRLVCLDARETLARFMEGETPNPERFAAVIGGELDRLSGAGMPFVYGEMVDLLWRDGQRETALRLERMWTELMPIRRFRLLCGYHLGGFASHTRTAEFDAICDEHTNVVPTSPTAEADPEMRRAIARLEQRNRALEREVLARQAAEEALKNALRERDAVTVLADRDRDALRLRAAAIVESSDDAIISKDLNGEITSWNEGAERLYGYTAREMIGRSVAVLIPEDHTNDFPMLLDRLRRGERIEHYETVRVAKDGRRIDVSLTLSPIRDVQGNIIGASKIARDITARRQTELALRASEERLALELAATTRLHALSSRLLTARTQVEALDDVLGNAIASSGAAFGHVQLLDHDEGTLRIHVQSGFPDEVLDRIERMGIGEDVANARAARQGYRVVVEDVQARPESAPHPEVAATMRYRSYQCSPLLSHRGQVLGVLSTYWRAPGPLSERNARLLDLHARHAADVIERFHAEHTLQEADRRKDEFIAILAHELRNPLAPVRNASHYLSLQNLDAPDLRRAVKMIDQQVSLMSRLIDDLLDVSRISRGRLELRPERALLQELVDAAIEACGHEVESRQHRVRVSLPPTPVPLHADRTRLIQVLCNLVTNAAKYSPRGSQIDVSAWVDENHMLSLSVRDRGAGIPREKLAEIFNLFAQLDRTLEHQNGGLGIGLTLARQIVELHGGSIEARSEGVGLGSEFVVRMPVLPAPLVTPAESPAPPRIATRRVLVADDNRDAADSLAMLLEMNGHEVIRAYDGRSAVELATRLRPDVLLLDIGMPELDGYDVARHIRELPWGADAMLVALTGWGQEQDERRAHAAGFDAHVVKPAKKEVLNQLLSGMPVRAVPQRH
jgi:PAS domain S-box-containing protein